MNLYIFILLSIAGICFSAEPSIKEKRIAQLQSQLWDLELQIVELERSTSRVNGEPKESSNDNSTYTDCTGAEGTEIRKVKIDGLEPFEVLCDRNDWMIIQQRKDDSLSFVRNWANYSSGFGNVRGNFFIGLEKIHRLTTSHPHELRLYLERNTHDAVAVFEHFQVGSEEEKFKLNVGTYKPESTVFSTAMFHNGSTFSTYDRPAPNNCAKHLKTAWWHTKYCLAHSNPNGEFVNKYPAEWGWIHRYTPVTYLSMAIRPKSPQKSPN